MDLAKKYEVRVYPTFAMVNEHGEVTAWTQPRRYQVGVRIDF